MADFCSQCSMEIFNKDYDDLSFGHPICDKGPLSYDWGNIALCEGCGPIVVDGKGKCISEDCELHGDKNNGS